MLFQPDINLNKNTVTAVDLHKIRINQKAYSTNVLIAPEGEIRPIHIDAPNQISPELLQEIIALAPEVLIIGTGSQQIFLHAQFLHPLYDAKIGVECMSSGAAARTYNVLMSEGRRVLALIFLDKHTPN